MFKRKSHPPQVGDSFVKVGENSGRVWVVIRLWTATDGLPHARMESNDRQRESRIISVSALIDDAFFVPVQTIPH